MSRKALARAWGAWLDLALRERLDDGTPVLWMVLQLNPDLAQRLDRVMSR